MGSTFSPKYEVFRKLLRRYRRDGRISQVRLAQKLKKTQAFISKYERGERRLDVVELLDILNALEINAATFLEELEAMLAPFKKKSPARPDGGRSTPLKKEKKGQAEKF